MTSPDLRLQEALFRDWNSPAIFDQAHADALAYLAGVRDRNVLPDAQALRGLAAFDVPIPATTGDAAAVLHLLHANGSPATVATLGGRYFGFVVGGALPVSLAAKALATFWDQVPGLYVLSPVAATLETVVERWLRELFGLPDDTVAGFVSGTSTANLCGLAAARWRVLQRAGWDVNARGLAGAPPIRIVAGKHAHSTVLKALQILGFGRETITWVDVDEQGRMLPGKLPPLDDRTILLLQAGNVNSGSFDPIAELCAKAKAAGAWVHIDGAFGLWAAATSELRHLTAGIEHGTSWAVDAHKSLNTPYDSGIVLCRDREALAASLSMSGGYIIVSEDKRDGLFYTPDMSRRARIVEIWAALAYLGKSGVDALITGFYRRATRFGEGLRKIDGITMVADVVFNQVLVRLDTDELTDRAVARIQELGDCWVGGSTWEGRKVIRVSICSWATTEEDVDRSVASFARAVRELRGR